MEYFNEHQHATILLVDDTPGNLGVLDHALRDQGFTVLVARDGESGLAKAQYAHPDLILLDVMMPGGMDGFTTCTQLKADPGTQDIPVIFMTALTDTVDKVKGFEAGGVDYVTKPLQHAEVLARVQTHLTLRNIRQSLETEIAVRKRAEEALQQRNHQLLLLNQIDHMFSSSLELEQVLKIALREVQRVLEVGVTSIWLIVPETKELKCWQIIGTQSENVSHVQLSMGQGITGWVARHGESVIIPDISSDPRHHPTIDEFFDPAVRSMLSIPLKVKGTVIGVLNLADPQSNRFSEEDLQFVESMSAAAAIAIENARLYQEVRDANEFLEQRVQERTRELAETIKAKERIESELRIAHNIQMGSLPHTFPDRSNLELYAVLEPAKEVGGDFYDFFFTDDRYLWFVVGDVSGKGVPAALFMSAAKTLIKAIALRLSPGKEDACIRLLQPAAVLTAVNQELSSNNDSCMFATVFCGVLNTETGEVCYTNAGHNAPLLLRREGESAFVARSNCGVIGPDGDMVFSNATLQLQPGEMLLLYTDGVTEALNRQQEEFSEKRLQETVAGHQEVTAEGIVNTVLSHVQAFAADVPQWDDITILAVTYCH